MNFNQLIGKLINNPVVVDATRQYGNFVQASGLLIKKPRFFKHDKSGTESCSFVLFQISNTQEKVEILSFSCMTYVKELVEQLKTVDKVLLLNCSGKLAYSKKIKGCYPQIVGIETLCEFDLDLENEDEIH